MSFFKKIFGSKNKQESEQETKNKDNLEPFKKTPWMTDLRLKNISICLDAGFRPASSLPTEFKRQIRPTIEIAQRLNAIKALILWVMVPEENLGTDEILNFIDKNGLKNFMDEEEKETLNISRNDEQARNSIGWKFENACTSLVFWI